MENYNDKYHVYIFDIEMPQMNGQELAKKIRARDAKDKEMRLDVVKKRRSFIPLLITVSMSKH